MDQPTKKPKVGYPIAELRTPCYVIDAAVAKRNCQRMQDRATKLGCKLRPHVKTHKTLEGGVIQTGGTKKGIVVSTLAEAQFFATGGFDDILYAVPITPDKLKEAGELTNSLTQFHIIVDHPVTLQAVLNAAPAPGKKWSIWIMVDCGYHRDGVDPEDPAAVQLAVDIAGSDHATLGGIYTHGGHSYDSKSVEEIVKIGEDEREAVVLFAERLRSKGVQVPEVGVGSTPTCSLPPAHLKGVTEMHPGNYFAYDTMQVDLGSCKLEDIAVKVLTRVIGQYPKSNMLLVDLGWTGCSAQGKECGYGVLDKPELRIKTLKQEAGEVEPAQHGDRLDMDKYPIGSIIALAPFHSCASTKQHSKVHVVENGIVVDEWKIASGW
mmetsp:Transcript_39682/g.48144  ORF Transcript_39682/g.48144 Transcript_39682/m.48144 type:complete len:378 (+) Transcript_39682:149-1282(+)